MKSKILIICFLSFFNLFAGGIPNDKATGVFLAIGVGPRIPVGNFSGTTALGYGFNLELSYTDNETLPIFLFGQLGFEQYPGSTEFYQESSYSHFSTNILPVHVGARYYFPPILEQFVLILPSVEFSASYALVQELNEFKAESGRSNFIDTKNKFGFSIGASISMFILELTGNYNFYDGNQTVSVDLKARLPLFINF